MTDLIQVMTTINSRDAAQKIAQSVVGQRLAACAQVMGPITSTYWWKGKRETAEEWVCLMKTRKELYEELEQAIRTAHSYEVPDIVAMPISAGLQSYLDWIVNETKQK